MHKDILLGKDTVYKATYDTSLIFPISRSENRKKLSMPVKKVNGGLPFYGCDIWTGYEVSWLNEKGKPEVAIAEFIIPCESENIVESKSFKLYLNSFNQTKLKGRKEAQLRMQEDLSKGFGADIQVILYDVMDYPLNQAGLGDNIDGLDIEVLEYSPNAALLKTLPEQVTETLNSHLLKSNCPVTNQPDWATLVIEYSGSKIDHEALLKYVISFRGHDDFHEHCVEQIFCDLLSVGEFDKLVVSARYTRRGGLDINPTRSLQAGFDEALIGRLARQ
jgi:7-cyano-7-deazaguanine reductase